MNLRGVDSGCASIDAMVLDLEATHAAHLEVRDARIEAEEQFRRFPARNAQRCLRPRSPSPATSSSATSSWGGGGE